MDNRTKEELLNDLEACRQLITSPEWSIWTKFLKVKRKGYLQNKVNMLIREKKYDEAQIALALMDDCEKQIELFGNFMREADSKLKGDKNGN